MNMALEKVKMGRPKDSHKRQGIIAAATELFLKYGFELTSMDAVAAEAGVSKLTIYSHFADKNDLFCAIMQNRCTNAGMPDSFMDLVDWQVRDALINIAGTAAAIIFHPDSIMLQRIIYAEAQRHPDIVAMFYKVGPGRIKEAFSALLHLYAQQGRLAIPDPELATAQFFSLIKGEKLLRTLMLITPPPTPKDLAEHVTANVDFFLKAYTPHNPKNLSPSKDKS